MNRTRTALVITVVHDPRDSRIWFRQISALLSEGWSVTYAAPLSADTLPARPVSAVGSSPRLIPLPRAHGRHRISAMLAARRLIRREAHSYDVVLIHDPELLLAAAGLHMTNLVWDVHEDTAAALANKDWLPAPLRPVTGRIIRGVETWAERQFTLILAEGSYQRRFHRDHVVVPNTVTVPERILPSMKDRVVYLGSVTAARGGDLLPEIGRGLRDRTGGQVVLEVIGHAFGEDSHRTLAEAVARGELVWHGYLPADQALPRLHGALAGLSLLDDSPNYLRSMPTKVLEYCAYGVPVITTPLPLAATLVKEKQVGLVVPWRDAGAVVDAALQLRGDPARAQGMAERGHRLAADCYDWRHWSHVFVNELESLAGRLEAAPAARFAANYRAS